MGKNKRDVDPQVKRDEIEEAASKLFAEHGYAATSMAMVAAEAGVAPNTLYWYYKNKDDMLVAALNRLVAEGLAEHAKMREAPLGTQLRWLINHMMRASKLVSTVHARLEHSEVIRDWHTQFHQMMDALLVEQLTAKGMSASKASLMATVGTFVVEGLLSHPHTAKQLDAAVAWLAGAAEG